MNNSIPEENYFHTLTISCYQPGVELSSMRKNIPYNAIEPSKEGMLDEVYKLFNATNCTTHDRIQPYYESGLQSRISYRKGYHDTTLAPMVSIIGMVGLAFSGGTCAYQITRTIDQLKKRNFKQVLKHGTFAAVSGITAIMLANLLFRI